MIFQAKEFHDPEINTKIQQYEMAYRMQTAVPEIMDVSKEPDDIVKMYGSECLVPGTYAANCLLARKLSENGVRFVQLYHQGWDQHGNLPLHGNGRAGQRCRYRQIGGISKGPETNAAYWMKHW